nr:hypothetical protein [Tanacetum cinerariifolium]
IASILGTLLYDEDENSPHFHRKRLCIKTSFQYIIFASQKIIVKGKEASILKDEFSDKNNDMEEIPETVFDKSEHVGNISPACNEDPFNIYDMLNKKKPTKSVEHSDSDIQYPPGFTPCDRPQVNSNLDYINQTKVLDKEPGAKASFQEDVNVSGCSGHFQSVKAPKSGGSILHIIEDFIKVGQTMGYKMKGCIKDFEEIMSSQGNSTVSDYFIAIMGNWHPNNKKLLVISVYAPQELAEKKSLWKYLNLLISRWNGEVLLMGDFNEVRLEEERYGSIFNSRGAAAFNSFIVDSGVPYGGFSFTCSHRPILLRELYVDYGPTPFCFFHNWFYLHGFDLFISDTWCNINIIEPNVMFKMAKKLKILKGHIRVWVKGKRASASNLKKYLKNKLSNIDSLIDKGNASSAILEDRLDTMNKLASLENMESSELAQKAKVKWSIEDDENSKFFHVSSTNFGTILPSVAPCATRLFMDMEFPNRLSSDQALDLERHFSKEVFKGAVWDCGLDKLPGPDGFTFGFYHRYWSLLEDEVVEAVN